MVAPKLRFKEFISQWDNKELGEVFTIFSGFPFKSTDAVTSGCRWLKIADVGCQTMTPDTPSFLPEYFKDEYSKFIIKENDCVIALTRPILNGNLKIAKVGNEYDNSLLNQRVGKLITKNNINFVYCLLQLEDTISKINSSISGTDPPNLSTQDIKNINVFMPGANEQTKIANFLSAVDERIQQVSQTHELLTQYKKGVMQKIFSQELRFKDENGQDFGEWEMFKYSEAMSHKSKKYNPSTSSSIPCIELEHIEQGSGKLIGFSDAKEQKSIKNIFNEGDVLFGKLRPYLRKYILAPFDGVCSSEIWVLKGNKVSNQFLFYMIQTESFIDLSNKSTGSKMPRADWSTIAEELCLIPPLPEQTKIASFLSAIDDKINQAQSQLSALQEYKRGLLQQMFV